MDIRTLTSFSRFKEIVTTLAKYGFDDMVERLDLPGGNVIKKISKIDPGLGTFERIRMAFQDLGPTFVKFGQVMSLRPDLLPPELIIELSKLQDDVPPVRIEEIREVIEQNTKRPLRETFSIFDPEPLAAASISQVHKGVLAADGRIVSIKVQRPGIRSKMERDLDILDLAAGRLQERIDDLKDLNLTELIRVLRKTLLRELDFIRESRNMKIARSNAGENADITIPEVYEEYCTEQLLVMEFIQGTKLREMKTETIFDPEKLARQGLHAAIDQILDQGFFHADPHPGNLIITPEERICLLDWGMTGRLSQRDRQELILLLKSILNKDGEAMVQSLLRVSVARKEVDRRSLERDLLDILDYHYAVPIKDMEVGQLLMAINDLLLTYRLVLPPDLVIMIKALVTAEGTARFIYPELDVLSEAKEKVLTLAAKRYRPSELWRSFRIGMSRLFTFQKDLPGRLERILNMANRGDLTFGFRHENLEGLMGTLDNVTNRLTFGIIIASMIIGSSMIITTGIGPFIFGFPALGVIGYIISGLLGLWLVVNIIRKKNY